MTESLPQDFTDTVANFAPTYSSSASYAVGDYVIHNGLLYICKTAIASGEAWTSGHWTQVNVGGELENKAAEISDLRSAFQNHEMVITPFVNNSYVDRDGNITNYTGWKRTDYLNIEKAESIAVVSSRQSAYNCFFDSNKNFIAAFTVGTTVTKITIPYGAVYVMFSNTNAGMDALVVKENTMSDAKIQVALDSATKQFNANNLDFVQGIYSSTGVINSNYAKAVNADIPSNSVYITNQYDGYYYFAVWDSSGMYVGAFYFSGFAASGSSGVYYGNIANIKPIFEQYPDATVKIVYIARNADDVLINTENFNTLFSLYVQDAESGSGIDPEVLVENTITGVYNSVDIDNKIAEYGALLVDSGKADTFLFFTDPHPFYTASTSGTLSDGWKDGINRKMPIIGKAYHSTGTAFCLCGGDWLGNTDTPAVACTKLGYVNGIMKNMFDRFYMLNGNHDVNEQGTEVLTDNALINAMFSREGKAYQAFKAANAKFYLFDTGAVFPSTMSSYRWEQIDWFGECLLADDDANNVIGLHIVTNQYKDSFESNPVFQTFATNIMAIAEAYNAKTTITMNEKTYDFTGTTGKVRFAIAGHSHFDAITTLHNIPIMITNWIRAGSVSTFDLVLADYENGVVKTVRIGSGSNRTMAMA